MNLIEQINYSFNQFLQNHFGLDRAVVTTCSFALNTDENKQQFGDISANAAMVLAKQLQKNPREIAQSVVDHFTHPHVEKTEIAGPGFLNMYLKESALQELARELATNHESFFKLDLNAPRERYCVEFVSANPTGPLHLGHGRGGIIGDVLCNILNYVGHSATREFYINDAGAQMQKLANSFKIRCQQVAGMDAVLPEEAYHGEYLIELAQKYIQETGADALDRSDLFFQEYAKEHMLAMLKQTLTEYGIEFDVWFSEKTLHEDGSIERAIQQLTDNGHTYQQEDALWFTSSFFGDDKDRVLKKGTGELTYVAADVAYLKNKSERDFTRLIMILGHDHHGYVSRLQGIVKALGIENSPLDVILYQLVKMKASGQLVRMSKRAGNIVTLKEVTETVGKDVARFFYLNRKADAQLEFDLDLALTTTEENPVYYIQYAYVRIKSILQKAAEVKEFANLNADDVKGISREEAVILKKIVALKGVLESIGITLQTHTLAHYAVELASTFHSYYSKHRVIVVNNVAQSRARLKMLQTLQETFEVVLTLLGVSLPEKM